MMCQRIIALAALLACTMLLASCAAESGGTEPVSIAELAEIQLATLPGVESVTVVQNPLDGTSVDADRWNPDLFSVRVVVTMTADTVPQLAAAAAEATSDFSAEHSGSGPFFAELNIGGPTHDPDLDMLIPNPVRVEVFPDPWRSPTQDVVAAMEARAIPGVLTVSIHNGWPSLASIGAEDLANAYNDAHGSALFLSGASYATMDGHLRLIALPHRVSPATVMTIIRVATDFPQADVALEAPLTGEQWPQLYLNSVTAQEATAITALLTATSLAAHRVEGYAVPYFMRVNGEDGQADVSGLLGGGA